jgi:DNA-binding cell septation regulator SpoVG
VDIIINQGHDSWQVRPLNVRLLGGGGNLRALADVEVGPLTIRGCRVVQQPHQRPFVQWPHSQGQDRRWWPVVQCSDRELTATMQRVVLAAWVEALATQSGGAA